MRAHFETGKKVVLIGHSKGGLDCAAALSLHPDLKNLVAGLVTLQSPFGGSPIAADLLADESLRAAVQFIFGAT